MSYQITLTVDGRTVYIPVLPKKIEVASPGKNEKVTVLELGEVMLPHKKGLRSISWESFFPVNPAPYTRSQTSVSTPISLIRLIQAVRDAKKAIRFTLTGNDLDINMLVLVELFDYEERAGEAGDIYYKIKLTEWLDTAPKRIVLTSTTTATTTSSSRAGTPATVQTHTVVKGDCLWSIAQKYYNNGNRYPEIYTANKTVIDNRNKGTGNPIYTIYGGQVLTIP